MNKEILDELNKIADDFWHDKKTLNRARIENISSLYVGGFAGHFDSALKEFLMVRKWNMENHDSSFDKILGVNPVKKYSDACDKFLEVITTAKTNDLIIDKDMIKKLSDLETKYNELEIALTEKNTIIEGLKTDRDYWHGRYDTLAKYVPLPKQDDSFESEVSDQ